MFLMGHQFKPVLLEQRPEFVSHQMAVKKNKKSSLAVWLMSLHTDNMTVQHLADKNWDLVKLHIVFCEVTTKMQKTTCFVLAYHRLEKTIASLIKHLIPFVHATEIILRRTNYITIKETPVRHSVPV